METLALTGITVHGCGTYPWWVTAIPFALLAIGWAASAAASKLAARRIRRRRRNMAKRIGNAWADAIADRNRRLDDSDQF